MCLLIDHEVGVHAWDHHRWQMGAERLPDAVMNAELERAVQAHTRGRIAINSDHAFVAGVKKYTADGHADINSDVKGPSDSDERGFLKVLDCVAVPGLGTRHRDLSCSYAPDEMTGHAPSRRMSRVRRWHTPSVAGLLEEMGRVSRSRRRRSRLQCAS